jgi:hypothetical protein
VEVVRAVHQDVMKGRDSTRGGERDEDADTDGLLIGPAQQITTRWEGVVGVGNVGYVGYGGVGVGYVNYVGGVGDLTGSCEYCRLREEKQEKMEEKRKRKEKNEEEEEDWYRVSWGQEQDDS